MQERITTAGVAISDNRVLIAQRKEGGPLSCLWEFPGGKNRYGESVEDTLKREWKEELSVDISVGEYITSVEFVNNDVSYHLKCHYVYPESQDFRLIEHLAMKYVPLDELLTYEFGPSDFAIASFLVNLKK